MPRTTPLSTAEEARGASPDGSMREVVSTELVEREAPSPAHSRIVDHLYEVLSTHADEGDLGAVFRAPWPVELSRYDLVRPDIVFVSWDRDEIMRVDGLVGSPDLIVEVTSPESWERDSGEKKRLYQWSRVPEYWVIDPDAQTFRAFTWTPQGYQPIPLDAGRVESLVLAGLEVRIDELFGALG